MAATLFSLVARAETVQVLDSEGKRISAAMVDPGSIVAIKQTDAEGLAVLTRTGSYVIRKQGFRSRLVRVAEGEDLEVRLERSSTEWTAPRCPERGDYFRFGTPGLGFPMLKGVLASPPVQDVDNMARSYMVETASGRGSIRHGSGANWSYGSPSSFDLKDTVEYEERASFFEEGFPLVTDARGRTVEGTHWRYVGMIGDSASYTGVNEDVAKALDAVLDGVCVALADTRRP